MMEKETIARVRLLIDNSQASEAIKKLRHDLTKAKEALDTATKQGDEPAMKQWRKEVVRLTQDINQQTTKVERLKKTIENLDEATPKQLREAIRQINKALDSGSVQRGSEDWKNYQKALREAKQQLKDIKEEQKAGPSTAFKDILQNFTNAVVSIQSATALYDRMVSTVQGYVQQYAEIQEAEAGVAKYTGLAKEEVRELNETFKQMDTRTPRERLNALAADAGRLGIQSKQGVLDFVEAADTINTVLGEDLGEDAVKNIGKLAQLFGDEKTMGLKNAMLATGSVINEIAQTSSASEPYLLEFTARMAGVGVQSGLTQAEIIGFASVLDQSMLGVERSSTALQNVFVAMMKKPKEFARVAGMSMGAFSELLGRDANAAFTKVLEGLRGKGDMQALAKTFTDLGMSGSGVVQVLSSLSGQIDKVREAQAQATEAYANGTSVTEEAAKANSTVQAQLEKNAERFKEVGRAIGEELLPVMDGMTSVTGVVGRLLLGVVRGVKEYQAGIVGLVTGLAVYLLYAHKSYLIEIGLMGLRKAGIVIERVRISLMGLYTMVVHRQSEATVKATLAQRGLNTTMMANPAGLLIASIAALVVGITLLATRTQALTSEQERQARIKKHLAEADEQARRDTADQVANIDVLRRALHSEITSHEQKMRIIAKLKQLIPGYTAELDAEGKVIRENTKAVTDYIAKLVQMAKAKALKGKIEELEKDKLEIDLKTEKAFAKAVEAKKRANQAMGGAGAITMATPMFGTVTVNSHNQAGVNQAKQAYINLLQQSKDKDKEIAALTAYAQKDTGTYNALVDALTGEDTTSGAPSTAGGEARKSKRGHTDDPQAKALATARKTSEAIKREAERQKAEADALYSSGTYTHSQYYAQIEAIEDESIAHRRDIYAKHKADQSELDKEVTDLTQERAGRYHTWSIETAEGEAKAKIAQLDTLLLSEEEHAERKQAIEYNLLRTKLEYARRYGQIDSIKASEDALHEHEEARRIERQKQTAERIKALREQYAEQTARQIYDIELRHLDAAHTEGLISEEEYQRLLQGIKKRYTEAEQKERQEAHDKAQQERQAREEKDLTDRLGERSSGQSPEVVELYASITAFGIRLQHARTYYAELERLRAENTISEQEYQTRKQEEDAKTYHAFAQAAQAAYAIVGGLMQGASQYAQAAQQAEIARINTRYKAEIAAAGEGSARATKLKEEQEAEIAKVKSKWAKRAMAMEMAQAVAATATNAILAYGAALKIPIAGLWLAPVAAAAAVAAGMLQIATIKKQHEAQAAGYYHGGYTGGHRYKREAGVVHEGEFVANHKAVANPHIRPLLDVIDRAQRNNTIGTLTLDQVRASLHPTPISAASSASTATAPVEVAVQQDAEHTAALQALATALKDGITATVQLDGQNGLHQQYTRYKRLTNQ